MSSENGSREDGFELKGEFYRWKVTDTGKDLMLIDRFSGMPVTDFFDTIEDNFDRGRAPILLALMATSIRAKNPDWSVERITRIVMNLSLGDDVTFIDSDEEESAGPPDLSGQEAAPSASPPAESSSLSTRPENSPSVTSSGSRA